MEKFVKFIYPLLFVIPAKAGTHPGHGHRLAPV